MNDRQLQTLAQLQAFLDGTAAVYLRLPPRSGTASSAARFAGFPVGALKRTEKAVVLRFLERVSGGGIHVSS